MAKEDPLGGRDIVPFNIIVVLSPNVCCLVCDLQASKKKIEIGISRYFEICPDDTQSLELEFVLDSIFVVHWFLK